MPATRTRTDRGITPSGESVPCVVSRVTVSPTDTPSCPARSCPSRMPGRPSTPSASVRGIRSWILPFRIALWISVTSTSSAGSIPFTVMKASLRLVDAMALPRIAGPAPTTPGTLRTAATSAL